MEYSASRILRKPTTARPGRLALVLLGICLVVFSTAHAEQVTEVALCERSGGECDAGDIRFQSGVCSDDPGQLCSRNSECGGSCVFPDPDPNLGFATAMGFLDGDGFADLAIGAPGEGRVYVFYGGVDNGSPAENSLQRDLSVGNADLILCAGPCATPDAGTQFGFALATAPRADSSGPNSPLIIGAPSTNDSDSPGSAYVVPAAFLASAPTGSFDIAAVTDVTTIVGAQAGDQAGYSVAMGPVLMAGSDDYVVGARLANGESGIVYAITEVTGQTIDLGGTRGGITVREVTGALAGEGLGEFLAIADFEDASTTAEVAIGAVGTDAIDPAEDYGGRAYIVNVSGGDVALPDDAIGWVEGDDATDFFGFSMVAADLDDDGTPDLAVGAIYANRPDNACGALVPEQVKSGAFYLFDGGITTSGMDASAEAELVFWGFRRWDELGFSFATGDVNGDGDPDLIAGARQHDRDQTEVNEVNEGAAYVFHGGDSSIFVNSGTICLDCPDPACEQIPSDVDAMIFGGDYDLALSLSEQAGFYLSAGDFNQDTMFDEIAISSVALGRVYLVSLQSTDAVNTNPDGQETDDYRDVRDRDDDGDGYLDVDEDSNQDGVAELPPVSNESDTLVPNTDATVTVTPANDGDLDCDGTIEVTVTVTNVGGALSFLDPELLINLPTVTEPGAPFEYIPAADASGMGGTEIIFDGVTTPVDENPVGTFPFSSFRSITQDGSPRTTDPITTTSPQDIIQVRFRLRAVLPLDFDADLTGDIDAVVQLQPEDNELPFPHDTPGLSEPNDDTGTVTLLVPDLAIVKSSTIVDVGPTDGQLDPLDQIEYTITVTNNGNYQATEVVVTDPIPVNTTLVPGSASVSQGSITEGDPIVATLGTILDNGGSATLTFSVAVDEALADGTVIENPSNIGSLVTVTETCLDTRVSDSSEVADNDNNEFGNDPDEPFDDDSTKDTVLVNPAIAVLKSAQVAQASVDDDIVYDYVVTNAGNVRLSSVTLTDDVCGPPTFTGGNDNMDGFLDREEVWTYTCTYTVQPTDPVGPLTNLATATGTPPVGAAVNGTDTVDVTIVNTPPVAVDDAEPTDTDTPTTVDVLANDTDVNTDPLSIVNLQAATDQGGTAAVNDNGTPGDPTDDFVDYTPAAGFKGDDTFTYQANDGTSDSNVATVTVTVNNAPPVAADDAETTATDTATTVDVLVNDTDANNDPLTIVNLQAATDQGGTAAVNDNGTPGDPTDDFVDYTPPAAFSGDDTFTYEVNDGTVDSNTATVTVTVSNSPPVAVDDAETTDTDTPTTVDVLANDTDANNDPLTIVNLQAATDQGGTAAVNDNGTPGDPTDDFVDYTPPAAFSGDDTFTYQVNDGTVDSNVATVTVTVSNSPPVAVDDAETTATDTATTVDVLVNDTDANNDPLTIVNLQAATDQGGTAAVNDNGTPGDPTDDFVDYTPPAAFSGDDTFTYQVNDGDTDSNVATVTVTIGNTPPVAVDDAETTDTDTPTTVDVLVNDTDANNDPLTIVNLQAATDQGGTAAVNDNGTPGDPTDDFVDYTPPAAFKGDDTFTYQVNDGTVDSNVATVTVTVLNAPPVAVDDADATDVDTATTVDVLVNDIDANNDPLTIATVQSPTDQGGTAAINDNGTPGDPTDDFVDYTPAAAFSGVDTFTYDVSDGVASDTATVTMTVTIPGPPPLGEPSFANFDGTRMTWTPITGTTYNLYRGDLAVLVSDGDCTQDPATVPAADRFCGLTESQYDDPYAPAPGEVVFYVVTSSNGAGEGGTGDDGNGDPRSNENPCE